MKPRPSGTPDRRIQRTRRSLRQALITLIIERGWEAVSVQDVCDRADVGRSTFYTHFADKEELLLGGLEDLRQEVHRLFAATPPKDQLLPFARGMIEHARDHRNLFLALAGKRTGQTVIQRFRELIVDLVREDVAPRAPAGPALEAAVHFIAGGFLELISWWLETESPLESKDIERILLSMAAPALDSLRGKRALPQ